MTGDYDPNKLHKNLPDSTKQLLAREHELEEEVRELEAENNEQEVHYNQLREAATLADGHIVELRAEVQSKTKELIYANTRASLRGTERDVYKKKVADFETDMAAKNVMFDSQEAAFSELEVKSGDLEEQLKEKNLEILHWKGQVADLETEKERLDAGWNKANGRILEVGLEHKSKVAELKAKHGSALIQIQEIAQAVGAVVGSQTSELPVHIKKLKSKVAEFDEIAKEAVAKWDTAFKRVGQLDEAIISTNIGVTNFVKLMPGEGLTLEEVVKCYRAAAVELLHHFSGYPEPGEDDGHTASDDWEVDKGRNLDEDNEEDD